MAQRQSIILLIILFFSISGTGYLINIDIAGRADAQTFLGNTSINDSHFEATTTVENIGSVGCSYRLKGVFVQNDSTYRSYSNPAGLYPGDTADLELRYYPFNYTEQVNASITLQYCGQQRELMNDSFSIETRHRIERTIDSRTIAVEQDSAKIELDEQTGMLIPSEIPGRWKASHTKVTEGAARLEYEAPLFNPNQELTYAWVNTTTDQVQGQVSVVLEDQRTRFERFTADRGNVLLVLSLLGNLVLLLLLGNQWREGNL